MRRIALCAALVLGCDDGEGLDSATIGVTSAATTIGGEESSSSDGVDAPAEPYGPCSVDADCPPMPSVDGEASPLQECADGTCTYACGDGWGDQLCPAGGSCVNYRGRCGVDMVENYPGACGDCSDDMGCASDANPTTCFYGCTALCKACPEGMHTGELGCVWQ